MKIYTRTGDKGQTALLGGTRVPKFDLRIEAYGTIDELNAFLGQLGDLEDSQLILPLLRAIQNQLFAIGSHLAQDPERPVAKLPELNQELTGRLEADIDRMEADLPPLKNFVLPGGHPANSLAHTCRCVCRRAERRVIELSENGGVQAEIPVFLNRLSDWLFVLSRYFSFQNGTEEIIWNP